MAARLAMRRSTESSKQLSVSKDKSLSAVTLTKKTNSLASDVEELKSNLKELQVQNREAEQQDQTLQDLVTKVERLQNAFDSLADVVIEEIDGIQKTQDALQRQLTALDASVAVLQDHVARVDGTQQQQQNVVDRRFEDAHDSFAKFALRQYEAQTDVFRIKHTVEQLLVRERDAARALTSLQTSHEQTGDAVERLRVENSQHSIDLLALQQAINSASSALATDVQALAKDCAAVRTLANQTNTQLVTKLATLQEVLERQALLNKSQLKQQLDALSDYVETHERRSKDAFTTLLKSDARIRIALDDSINTNTSELRALAHDVHATQCEQQSRLDALAAQFTTHAVDTTRKYENLEAALRVVAT